MLPVSQSAVHVSAQAKKMLIVSGVNISKPATTHSKEKPTPDYVPLIETLQPDILDMHNIQTIMNPLLGFVQRVLGLQWSIALATFFRRRQYQAVIATGEDVGLPLALLLKLSGSRLPLVIMCHNLFSRRPAFLLGKLKAGAVVQTFQCLSQAQARTLQDRFGVRSNQIQLVYYHVDHRFFHPMPDATVRNQICSVGLASRDYATLIEATRNIDTDVKIVAGSAWFDETMNIAPEAFHDRAALCSADTSPELRQLYAESLFAVVPLRDVPRCVGLTAILESMAMGKAVIVTKIQQGDDLVVDGWNGFHVEPGNVAQLRERIAYLLEHPEEARRLGANARQTVEDRFTLQHYVERTQAALGDALGGHVGA